MRKLITYFPELTRKIMGELIFLAIVISFFAILYALESIAILISYYDWSGAIKVFILALIYFGLLKIVIFKLKKKFE